MPSFGKRSLGKLATCDDRLQNICNKIIKYYDFSVISGYRGKEEQNRLVIDGKSTKNYPHSKHNSNPSMAVDVAPWPINWTNRARFYLLAGMMFAEANNVGLILRWGGDWDQDWDHSDQKFFDLPHFEILEEHK